MFGYSITSSIINYELIWLNMLLQLPSLLTGGSGQHFVAWGGHQYLISKETKEKILDFSGTKITPNTISKQVQDPEILGCSLQQQINVETQHWDYLQEMTEQAALPGKVFFLACCIAARCCISSLVRWKTALSEDICWSSNLRNNDSGTEKRKKSEKLIKGAGFGFD